MESLGLPQEQLKKGFLMPGIGGFTRKPMALAERIVSPSNVCPLNYICIHINLYVFSVILICILCNSMYSLEFFSDSPSVLLVLPHVLR